MFNIAKSVEAMFSQWAIKRLCKFLLKKKLGEFILGDVDLDQLDVQLSAGTIQLSDVALNVDYLNQKLGAAAASVVVKEGSIGSLLVKMPWRGDGCQIDIDELELLLGPGTENNSQGGETCVHSQAGKDDTGQGLGKLEHEMVDNAAMSNFSDVHEGVKTIAKIVKWLLTSFHVKVRKLIVAFDPCSEKDEKKTVFGKALVLRIDEIECGTCISEDDNSNSDTRVESLLGISRLMNFVKFQGAIFELLQMDNVDNQTSLSCSSGSFTELLSGFCPSNATTTIMTGERGGFSGTLKLSIPWKNGSLDIHKLDADVYIDPVELRFQPSTIKWLLLLWESLTSSGRDGRGHMHHRTNDSIFNLTSYCYSSTLDSAAVSTDKVIPPPESSAADFCSTMGQESATDTLLPGLYLISDWVPLSTNNQTHSTEEELAFGASVDQFFECFDGMRSYQSALGNSGIWNWTCSVFSAITAASSLASGSLHMPTKQQHVETNLKATIAGISVVFSFHDENQRHSCDLGGAQANVGSNIHYLGAECRDLLLVLQVCPQNMKFDATVRHIELADYYKDETDVADFALHGYDNNSHSQTLLVERLQAEVEGVLPPFASFAEDPDVERSSGSVTALSLDSCICRSSSANIEEDDLVKITLFRTSGVSHCLFIINSSSANDSLARATSFTLKLPPVVFWINFQMINMLLDLSMQFENSLEVNGNCNSFPSEALNKEYRPSLEDVKRGTGSCVTTLSSRESFQGNIFLPIARVILCFPFKNDGKSGCYSSWDQFLVLDFSLPSSLDKRIIQDTCRIPNSDSQKRFSLTASRSLHLNVGNLDAYLVTSACEDGVEINSCKVQRHKFSAHSILSATNRTRFNVISMLWQEGPVTGRWIAEKAKSLAASAESRTRSKFMGKAHEFASVTTVKNPEDSRTRQEIILSSAFFLHVQLSPVTVNLGRSQYNDLHNLLNEVINGLSSVAHDPVNVSEEASISQISILVECDSLEILINPDIVESIKGSLQSELPGSWHRIKLKIQKFELLSVSNIGGIKGAKFLWVGHGEGKLWGSITSSPERELLLILCSNSTLKRGDGEGSNVLSSRLAGSDIIHLWDPESVHNYTSVTVRCSTVVAVGGRLDWLETISSFFSLPSAETEEPGYNSSEKGDLSASFGSSFFLNLVDIGLSYEPYFKHLLASGEVFDSESSSANHEEEYGEQHVACMLAASSLRLSNTTMANSTDNEYKIRIQDLGLLVCAVLDPDNIGGSYSSQHLQKVGYVKVAEEALFEAILRTNCKNGLPWELECLESHIRLGTCHDTTSGLICLVSQIQQLFAPDVEESIVHLQTRWNTVQQAQERNDSNDETVILYGDTSPPASEVHMPSEDTKSEPGLFSLMDEISEDAFRVGGNVTCQLDSCESQLHISLDGTFLGDACNLSIRNPEFFSRNLSCNGTIPVLGLDSHQSSFTQNGGFLEFTESHCMSETCHVSEISVGNEPSQDILKCKCRNAENEDLERGSSGWYGDAKFKIVENHILETSEQTSLKQSVKGRLLSSTAHRRPDDLGKPRGRVLLKNVNVKWRMYAGSDWNHPGKSGQPSGNIIGRDSATCLELALSGIDFQYDIFPDGEICISKLSLSIMDFHLSDKGKDAPWQLVLGYYNSKDHPRVSSSKAFKLDLEAVRPDPSTPLEEYRLQIAVLPIRLHLHQSQLDFLVSFFGRENPLVEQSPSHCQDSDGTKLSSTKNNRFAGHIIAEEALLPYFQKFDMWPVLVRVDYRPLRVDLAALRGGKYVELVNLVNWKGVELNLKHVHAVGVYGWSSVCETIIGEWLEDISQNQIHKLLQGLPTIRSFVAVSSGAAKLVSLPVKNYKKDQRIIKGMQRGTIAFLRSISLEAVSLGVHLAAGAHDILLQAEYMLANIPPSVPWPPESRTKTNIRSNQPKDAQQGIRQAYESLSDGLGKSASALVRTPLKNYQRGAGAGSALATAVRGAPAAAIAPASAAARAVHCALLGVRNSLDPEHKKESMEKYLGPAKPGEQI